MDKEYDVFLLSTEGSYTSWPQHSTASTIWPRLHSLLAMNILCIPGHVGFASPHLQHVHEPVSSHSLRAATPKLLCDSENKLGHFSMYLSSWTYEVGLWLPQAHTHRRNCVHTCVRTRAHMKIPSDVKVHLGFKTSFPYFKNRAPPKIGSDCVPQAVLKLPL